MTKQQHLLPLVATFVMVAGIIVLMQAQIKFSNVGVTLVILTYFVSNIAYSMHQKTFSLKRLAEIGLIAIILQYAALTYII